MYTRDIQPIDLDKRDGAKDVLCLAIKSRDWDIKAQLDAIEAVVAVVYPGSLWTAKQVEEQGMNNIVYLATQVQGQKSLPHKLASLDRVIVRIAHKRNHDTPKDFEAEIAAMRHVYCHTQIPVPKVLAYSIDDHISVMEFISEGMRLNRAWPKLTPMARKQTVRDYARIISELHKVDGYKGIGSLQIESGCGLTPLRPPSLPNSDPSTKPLETTFKNAETLLKTVLQTRSDYLKQADPNDRKGLPYWADLKDAQEVYEALLERLPRICRPVDDCPRMCLRALCLRGISRNIIVRPSDGTIVAVIDWEKVNILPAALLSWLPLFLTEGLSKTESVAAVQAYRQIIKETDPDLLVYFDPSYDDFREVAWVAAMDVWYNMETREIMSIVQRTP
ncbi:hypothetical protein DACRYDRAFT_112006 [Dacryopinax primogenitus]|uniref:Aminoglycoside phosphotransferase domain-containing protein n=1 Tax=Dacryopinax primogenitus (strain DJM 731) TaxID=1858805 RepID=M5FVT0_DACPD|nr:uncharacterized protein DACRYDRAFT_112006 [Dacryopinax primogenitus]EJT97471.1 hypothetical protein DACRYDRAFT_112006 [Dacryopinax primogenitus]